MDTKQAIKLALKVSFKSTMPILSSVKLSRNRVEATDLDSYLTMHVSDDIGGSIIVDAAKMKGAAKKDTVLSVREGKLTAGALTLNEIAPIGDWPATPEIVNRGAPGRHWTFDGKALSEALRAVIPAMSYDFSRFNLDGVYLEVWPFGARVTATDGHRLHLADIGEVPPGDPQGACILPARAVAALAALADTYDGPIEINAGETSQKTPIWRFSSPDWEYLIRPADAQFPAYRQVIPDKFIRTDRVSAGEILPSLKEAAKLKGKRPVAVKLSVNHAIRVQAKNDDGAVDAAASIISTEGKDELEDRGFNPAYLVEAIAACGESANWQWPEDTAAPLVIAEKRILCVIMPVRI